MVFYLNKTFYETPLEIAITKGSILIVKTLIENGADINESSVPSIIETK